jgi:hypothetical protein
MSRTSYGLQSIDQKLGNLLKPLFQGSKKEFVMINNLAKNWEEIIGKKYAAFCQPKSVNFNKDKSGARLTIAVYNPAVGFFLDNNSEIILERIAISYGFKSINKIIIKQEPKQLEGSSKTEIKLPKSEEENLQQKIKDVTDPELARVLAELGREVFRKN